MGWNLKTILSYLKSAPSNLKSTHRICLIAKFREIQKYLNLKPKMPDLRIFGLEFEYIIVIFEIFVLEFVLLQGLVKNKYCHI